MSSCVSWSCHMHKLLFCFRLSSPLALVMFPWSTLGSSWALGGRIVILLCRLTIYNQTPCSLFLPSWCSVLRLWGNHHLLGKKSLRKNDRRINLWVQRKGHKRKLATRFIEKVIDTMFPPGKCPIATFNPSRKLFTLSIIFTSKLTHWAYLVNSIMNVALMVQV